MPQVVIQNISAPKTDKNMEDSHNDHTSYENNNSELPPPPPFFELELKPSIPPKLSKLSFYLTIFKKK